MIELFNLFTKKEMVESINHLDKLEMLKFRQKPAINPKDK